MHERVKWSLIGLLLLPLFLLSVSIGVVCHSHACQQDDASCVFCVAVQQAPLVSPAILVFVVGLVFRLSLVPPAALPAAPYFLASGARGPPL